MIDETLFVMLFYILSLLVRKQIYLAEFRNNNKIVIHMISKYWNWHLPWRYLWIAVDLDSGI
jgi:hypothetical protein